MGDVDSPLSSVELDVPSRDAGRDRPSGQSFAVEGRIDARCLCFLDTQFRVDSLGQSDSCSCGAYLERVGGFVMDLEEACYVAGGVGCRSLHYRSVTSMNYVGVRIALFPAILCAAL